MKNIILAEHFTEYYEKVASGSSNLYSGSGFMNYGYWDGKIKYPAEASKKLVEHLVSFIANFDGNLLNVACGNGSEIEIFAQYFHPKNITSINISKPQLERAAKRSPETRFIQMSVTELYL